MATELRRTTRSQCFEHQLMQWLHQVPILGLKGSAITAKDVGNFTGRSRHWRSQSQAILDRYLLSDGLGILGEEIWKVVSGARCSFRNVRIGRRGFQVCMSENLLKGAYIHARQLAMRRIAVAQGMGRAAFFNPSDPLG